MPPRRSVTALVAASSIAVTTLLSGCTTISTLVQAYEISTKPAPTPTVASHPPTGLLALAVGDCVNREPLEDGDETTDPIVSCASPHDLEVYASVVLPDGDYPSVDALTNQGAADCGKEFGTFVGVDFGISDLDFLYYYPTESSWASGDREIDCLIFDPSSKTTGSLANAKR